MVTVLDERHFLHATSMHSLRLEATSIGETHPVVRKAGMVMTHDKVNNCLSSWDVECGLEIDSGRLLAKAFTHGPFNTFFGFATCNWLVNMNTHSWTGRCCRNAHPWWTQPRSWTVSKVEPCPILLETQLGRVQCLSGSQS